MYNQWTKHFMSIAHLTASKSKDTSTKVGAVFTDFENTQLSSGYNGLPRGIEYIPERLERPLKYKYFEHAERNAIYNAVRKGIPLMDSTLYVTSFPCSDCARAIIQSGCTRVVYEANPELEARWAEDMAVASQMLNEARITVSRRNFDYETGIPRGK
jgi:dCMP deaminase